MKKIFLILFVAVVQLLAQKVTVVADRALTSLSEGNFYYPTLNPDGTGVLFSSENYKGLWYKNFSTGKTVKITEALGAGYEPGFGISNEILYRDDKFVRGKKFSSLISYDMVSKKAAVLEGGIRDLKICRDNSNAFKNYVKETEVCFTMKQKMLQKSATPERVVFIQDSKIVLSENNTKKVLQPLGEGNYIWPSLSPDKTKLLFTFVGKGTYISNLEGAILTKIGYANYPSWSPDGNWILFMKDIDNGVNIISSDVYIANLKTGKYFNITLQRDDISLYPKWGAANSGIFYNTDNGQIRKIKLTYK
jgi:Tol biopolymer transport system component